MSAHYLILYDPTHLEPVQQYLSNRTHSVQFSNTTYYLEFPQHQIEYSFCPCRTGEINYKFLATLLKEFDKKYVKIFHTSEMVAQLLPLIE